MVFNAALSERFFFEAVFPLHGGNLVKDISLNQAIKILNKKDGLDLPLLSHFSDSALSQGKLMQVDGTNVVRVPFGVRFPRKKRPQSPRRLATLVLPLQRLGGSPTPPPHAA